jgi:hypothetical protein
VTGPRLSGLAAIAMTIALSPPALAAAKKSGADLDPEREICKSRPVIGSRVKRVRECHTAQQWEDIGLQDRLMMSTKQFNGDRSEAPADSKGLISPN